MTDSSRSIPDAGLAGARAQLTQQWRALSERDRMVATLGAVVVGVFLVMVVAVMPAMRTLSTTPARINKLDAELQLMQNQAAEARQLSEIPPVAPGLAQEALQAATTRLGAERASLSLQGDRATLQLINVTGEQLRGWLSEARSGARARPVEAQLNRMADGGYSGTVTVILGSGN